MQLHSMKPDFQTAMNIICTGQFRFTQVINVTSASWTTYRQCVSCLWQQRRRAAIYRCSTSDRSSVQLCHSPPCSATSDRVCWDLCRRHSALCAWMPIWQSQEPAWTAEAEWPKMLSKHSITNVSARSELWQRWLYD